MDLGCLAVALLVVVTIPDESTKPFDEAVRRSVADEVWDEVWPTKPFDEA